MKERVLRKKKMKKQSLFLKKTSYQGKGLNNKFL